MHDSADVVAVVLTHNSPAGLAGCLKALQRQTCPVREIIVVDNASAQRVDDIARSVPGVRLIRLETNEGPAGGHARGLDAFLETAPTAGWAWVMDDDCEPRPSALYHMLDVADGPPGASVVFPRAMGSVTGGDVDGVGWLGVLIARDVVEEVGVPIRELFWWAEDTEYLQWRIPKAGFRTAVAADALVDVRTGRPSRAKPAWKYYYEARGSAYYRLHVQECGPSPPGAERFTIRVRVWRMSRSLTKLLGRALLVERETRARKAGMVVRGAADGIRGRLGRRVPVDDSHRPSSS